jgi:hypothetical protein
MSIAEKYGLIPVNHVLDGNDITWVDDNNERIIAEGLLTRSCVVGVELSHRLDGPGYCGVTYSDGLYAYIVVLRVHQPRTDLMRHTHITLEDERSTRKHELTQWWWTLVVDGTKQLREVFDAAQPHPDDEEEWR